MNKQTNAQGTLKRGKGKYKGDEDKLKSSTQIPEKELRLLNSRIKLTIEFYKMISQYCEDLRKIFREQKIKDN